MSSEASVDGAEKPAGKGGKRKLLVVGLAVLVLAGAGAGGWFSGFIPKMLGHGGGEGHAAEERGGHGGAAHGEGDKKDAKDEKPATVFMDLPDIVANLNGGPRRAVFVKLKAKLELARPEDQATLTAAMPRVLDLFGAYLREMRPEELRGTAGTYRLREELLARTNLAAPPARVVAVLFTELLVQ